MLKISMSVPPSILQLMREAPNAPSEAIDEKAIEEYVTGITIAALWLMGPTGEAIAQEMRAEYERQGR